MLLLVLAHLRMQVASSNMQKHCVCCHSLSEQAERLKGIRSEAEVEVPSDLLINASCQRPLKLALIR